MDTVASSPRVRPEASDLVRVRLTSVTWAAPGVNICELRSLDGSDLLPFTAGAHIDVHLPGGLVRQYSLLNPQHETHRYVLGIKHDVNGRGGSRYLHTEVRVGTVLTVGPPRNNFALFESAPSLVFIAGGIGITPILCMLERAARLDLDWHLYYAVRKSEELAFLDMLAPWRERCSLHVDADHSDTHMDLADVLASVPASAHLYCCGPRPMLDGFLAAAARWPAAQVHVEYFGAAPVRATGGYVVELARSARRLNIEPGQSILQALRAAGIAAPSACEQGICGSCETAVLVGTPEHRDMLLSDADKAANKTMMICCSGCIGDLLVLDL